MLAVSKVARGTFCSAPLLHRFSGAGAKASLKNSPVNTGLSTAAHQLTSQKRLPTHLPPGLATRLPHTENYLTTEEPTTRIITSSYIDTRDMGCTKIGHCHQWPTSGTLVIQRCEIRCNFCDGDQGRKDWKYAWFLRRHVRAVHVKRGKYPDLEVDVGWDENAPKGTKKGTRSAFKKGAIKVKAEYPDTFVQQPVYDGQLYGRLPGAFSATSTVIDRTVSPNDPGSVRVDPYATSINDISFRTEDPALMQAYRINTADDFESWIKHLVDGLDIRIKNAGLFGNDSSDVAVDPTLTRHLHDATNVGESAAYSTAHENIGLSTDRTKGKHQRSESDIATARYFMDDYESLAADAIEDMPLAEISNHHIQDERPNFEEYWRLFSENVDKTADQMRDEGIDIEAVENMIPAITLFARSLQECKGDRR